MGGTKYRIKWKKREAGGDAEDERGTLNIRAKAGKEGSKC